MCFPLFLAIHAFAYPFVLFGAVRGYGRRGADFGDIAIAAVAAVADHIDVIDLQRTIQSCLICHYFPTMIIVTLSFGMVCHEHIRIF